MQLLKFFISGVFLRLRLRTSSSATPLQKLDR